MVINPESSLLQNALLKLKKEMLMKFYNNGQTSFKKELTVLGISIHLLQSIVLSCFLNIFTKKASKIPKYGSRCG
jgi:hypothetical protein